jgi:hypothetical protein
MIGQGDLRDLRFDVSTKKLVVVRYERGYPYTCYNTGRNVVLAQEVGSGHTWEAFSDELRRVSVLDILASLG